MIFSQNRDVFISYSHQDRDWLLVHLLPKMDARSISYFIDKRDFVPGEHLPVKIGNSIQQSRKFLCVLSNNYLSSKWAMDELSLAKSLGVDKDSGYLIPVVLERCALPVFIKNLIAFEVEALKDEKDWDPLWNAIMLDGWTSTERTEHGFQRQTAIRFAKPEIVQPAKFEVKEIIRNIRNIQDELKLNNVDFLDGINKYLNHDDRVDLNSWRLWREGKKEPSSYLSAKIFSATQNLKTEKIA